MLAYLVFLVLLIVHNIRTLFLGIWRNDKPTNWWLFTNYKKNYRKNDNGCLFGCLRGTKVLPLVLIMAVRCERDNYQVIISSKKVKKIDNNIFRLWHFIKQQCVNISLVIFFSYPLYMSLNLQFLKQRWRQLLALQSRL